MIVVLGWHIHKPVPYINRIYITQMPHGQALIETENWTLGVWNLRHNLDTSGTVNNSSLYFFHRTESQCIIIRMLIYIFTVLLQSFQFQELLCRWSECQNIFLNLDICQLICCKCKWSNYDNSKCKKKRFCMYFSIFSVSKHSCATPVSDDRYNYMEPQLWSF